MTKKYSLIFIIASVFFSLVYCDKVGNPDDTDHYQRPCAVYDQNCIRDFFEQHAHCKRSYGPIPDVVIRPQVNYYFAAVNTSVTAIDLITRVSNPRINEFYIDIETDKLVIAIEYQNYSLSSELGYFRYHRRAKEPVITVAPVSGVFNNIIVTAVIPNLKDLQLELAECTTFADNPVFEADVGPAAGQSTDPQVQVAFAEFPVNLAFNTQELYFTDSAFFATLFIQYNICDFGIFVP